MSKIIGDWTTDQVCDMGGPLRPFFWNSTLTSGESCWSVDAKIRWYNEHGIPIPNWRPETKRKAAVNYVLYRCYDSRHKLLYVGITMNPGTRFTKGHAKNKEWWPQVDYMKLEHFDDRQSLEDAERQAIATELPMYNITGQLK